MIIKQIKTKIIYSVSLVALTSISISGCNSFYKNEYVYLPPSENPEARNCLLACHNSKESCDHSANKAYQECLREAESSSMLNYTIDLNNQNTSVTTKEVRTIEQCRTYSKGCERSYNECYVGCGGKVEVNDYSTVK